MTVSANDAAGRGWRILCGNAADRLKDLPDASVDCCVTSPPYWGLRDYGVEGQMGLEPTYQEYVEKMVAVFREVRRVLRDDGTLWLNLGDSYAAGGMSNPSGKSTLGGGKDRGASGYAISRATPDGLKPKDLVGIPWRVAFALQADGWYLRSDIIWSKPNPMPESVTDRPTKAHEYLFLLSKSDKYYYDAAAIAEDGQSRGPCDPSAIWRESEMDNNRTGGTSTGLGSFEKRNKRTVWTIGSEPFPGAHFAVMPTALVKPCVLAGCRPLGTVLDPFTGSGTVCRVAIDNNCQFVGTELNPEYVAIAANRMSQDAFAFDVQQDDGVFA